MSELEQEPHFIVMAEIKTTDERKDLIAFQLTTKRQLGSNPSEPSLPVSEFLEPDSHLSPVYLLTNEGAANFARELLDTVGESS